MTLADVFDDPATESPCDAAIRALMPEMLEKVLAPLDERERTIISLRYGLDRGEPRTYEEVAAYVPLTRADSADRAEGDPRLRSQLANTGAHDLLHA